MTRFIFARHAAHDWIGRGLAGRMPGVPLNAQGHVEAAALARRLADSGIAGLYSSPQLRTRETAAAIAQALNLSVEIASEFDEVDFGEWTGLTFDEVRRVGGELWTCWLEQRSRSVPPGGEPFAGVQQRALQGMERLRQVRPEGSILIVSHGDVIKSVLAAYLRVSLDDLERFDISCASLSVVDTAGTWSQVKLVNGVALSVE